MCLDIALSLSFSKRRQGSAGLAPTKALKMGPVLQPVLRRAMPVGWPPHKAPSGGGARRHELPWGKPPRLTPCWSGHHAGGGRWRGRGPEPA
jgi:hypothetical protein